MLRSLSTSNRLASYTMPANNVDILNLEQGTEYRAPERSPEITAASVIRQAITI